MTPPQVSVSHRIARGVVTDSPTYNMCWSGRIEHRGDYIGGVGRGGCKDPRVGGVPGWGASA